MTSIRALIIEDNRYNSDVLCEFLNSEAVDCSVIQDARSVSDYVNQNPPADVVFLDLEMPHLDGYEILDILKSDDYWKSVPVVACTVHSTEFQTARSKPFHSFLAKPLNADHFSHQLHRILNGEAVWEINPTD